MPDNKSEKSLVAGQRNHELGTSHLFTSKIFTDHTFKYFLISVLSGYTLITISQFSLVDHYDIFSPLSLLITKQYLITTERD